MNQVLHLASVWVHILAASVWLGGMVFLTLVLAPALRASALRDRAGELIHETGVRFRCVGWICLGLLIATGIINLATWGLGWSLFTSGQSWGSPSGHILAGKLALMAIVLLMSAIHDFSIGPRATALARQAPGSERAERLRRMAGWLGGANLLLGLVIVGSAVLLVRGSPW